MVRISNLSKWILVFIIQVLLLVCFIAKTGLQNSRNSLNMEKEAVDPPSNSLQDKPAVESKNAAGKGNLPEHEISTQPRTTTKSPYNTDVVIGIPSIKRPQGKVYLDQTLKYLIERRGKIERVVFLVYLAEQDVEWRNDMATIVNQTFPKEVNSGMIRVIASPPSIYPDWERDMKLTLGDPFHQVKWRSKQNLDSAYLIEYAHSLNTKYYLGIEDDVKASENYLEQIIEHANREWHDGIMFASYCTQGAIGKLFFNKDLLTVATYLKTFWNYKPLDWLYFDLKSLVACRYPRTNCDKEANSVVLEYKQSLFSHSGKISSLVKKQA